MTAFKHIVTNKETNIRLDKLLTQLNRSYTRSYIQSWIKEGLVYVNGKNVKANYLTKKDDVITWSIKEKTKIELLPENIPLSIIFEDDDLLILNKQKGLVVHPSESYPKGTLVNGLLNYTETLADAAGEHRPGIVHRLDKDTSGLLVVAKTNVAYKLLTEQFANRTVTRKYQTLVHGSLKHEQGTIDAPIGRHPKKRQQMAVISDGKQAITHFKVIERLANFTRIECQLETGRTHQIRVHLAHIGHPVVGDPIYCRKKRFNNNGQILHAFYLSFRHPITNERMSFKTNLPAYFKEVLQQIRKF